MAIITNSLLRAIDRQLSREFQRARQAAKTNWMRVATRVPSGTAEQVYGWLKEFPLMREWAKGADRPFADIAENAVSVTNKKWGNGVKIARESIEDDQLGIYAPMVRSLGQESMLSIDRETFKAMNGGFRAICYDGQNFFDTDHPVAANVDGTGGTEDVSNVLLGAPTAAVRTAGATAADAVTTGGTVKGYARYKIAFTVAGAIGAAAFTLSVNGGAASAAVVTAAGGYDIPNTGIHIDFEAGTVFVVGDAWEWRGRRAWYLLATMHELKPMIYQERTPVEIESVMRLDDNNVFLKDEYWYGARARRAYSYGYWQMAIASTQELTEDTFDEAYQRMQDFTWDGGTPCGFMPDLLACAPAQRSESNEVINQQFKTGGESNPNHMAAEVLCTPWLNAAA